MENNQFQNNQQQQYSQYQQYSQPQQQYVQPPVYAKPKSTSSISLDFLKGPDKNKFIFAGGARLATNLVTGVLYAIYTLILNNVYISSTGFSWCLSAVYSIIAQLVTIAIGFGLGYMLYKDIIDSIKFAGVVSLGGIIGTAISNVFGAAVYLLLGIFDAYGTVLSIANFFVNALAWIVGAVACVALMAVVEKKIDLSKLISSKPKQTPVQPVVAPVENQGYAPVQPVAPVQIQENAPMQQAPVSEFANAPQNSFNSDMNNGF